MAGVRKLARSLPKITFPIVGYDRYDGEYAISFKQDSEELFSNRCALIGITGAFFPSAQYRLLPEYFQLRNEIRALGKLHNLFITSVNDPYVLKTFAEEIDAEEHFVYIADQEALLATALGAKADLGEYIGERSRPYSAIIEDNEVKMLNLESEWEVSKISRAYHLLNKLSPYLDYPGTVYPN